MVGLAELAISADDFHSLWQDIGAADVEKTADLASKLWHCCAGGVNLLPMMATVKPKLSKIAWKWAKIAQCFRMSSNSRKTISWQIMDQICHPNILHCN